MLASINVPTLVIAGCDDVIVPLKETRAMADAIPSATLHEIKNAGHIPPLERPGDFNEALQEFLSGL